MLQHILHERRFGAGFGGQPSHELSDAAAKCIPEYRIVSQDSAFPRLKGLISDTALHLYGIQLQVLAISGRTHIGPASIMNTDPRVGS